MCDAMCSVFNMLTDDFAGATAQERFLIMMNERVGNIEVAVTELRDLMTNLHDFLTTDAAYCALDVPKLSHAEIGPAFLDTFIEAMQKAHRVSVDAAWCSVHDHRESHKCIIYVLLKNPVILSRVSREINVHLAAAFPFINEPLLDIEEWRTTTRHAIHRATRDDPAYKFRRLVIRQRGGPSSMLHDPLGPPPVV